MEVIRSSKELQSKMINNGHKKVGFVPTMGYLHEGHTSLMDVAKKENDIVVTSIFVNPLQFGPNEDFEKYPRNNKKDMDLAKKCGINILFLPDVQTIYPNEMSLSMIVEKRTDVLCGRSRPGHFDGVVTVLTKLFNIVQPNKTYFGMKDAQQLAIVKKLIIDLNFPIELIGLPTIREQNGLARSSRNVYLDENEYEEATWLYNVLLFGQQLVANGEKNPETIVKQVRELLATKTSGTIDYVELLSYPDLLPTTSYSSQNILAVAVQFTHARLIDNIIFDPTGKLFNRLS